jgi:hypothetical protein
MSKEEKKTIEVPDYHTGELRRVDPKEWIQDQQTGAWKKRNRTIPPNKRKPKASTVIGA